MEFPSLGQQCSETSCKQLDFLPLKCDACDGVFCRHHFSYDTHRCPSAHLKNVQVPICPLCNQPVPCRRGEAPDIGVSQHIDNDCQSDRAKDQRKAIFTNKCSLRGCKNKELMPLICDACRKNYCLKHRHFSDHKCQPLAKQGPDVSKSGAAALWRLQNPNQKQNKSQETNNKNAQRPKTRSDLREMQGNLSEDEALAKALQQSMLDNSQAKATADSNQNSNLQETEDQMLAAAIAASEREMNRNKDKQCVLS